MLSVTETVPAGESNLLGKTKTRNVISATDSSNRRSSTTYRSEDDDQSSAVPVLSPFSADAVPSNFSSRGMAPSVPVAESLPPSYTSEESLGEKIYHAKKDTQALENFLPSGVTKGMNCCCQILLERLAVEVKQRLEAERKAMEVARNGVDLLPKGALRIQEKDSDEKELDGNPGVLEGFRNSDKSWTKEDLEKEVICLRELLQSRDREIALKEVRIGLLFDKLMNSVPEGSNKSQSLRNFPTSALQSSGRNVQNISARSLRTACLLPTPSPVVRARGVESFPLSKPSSPPFYADGNTYASHGLGRNALSKPVAGAPSRRGFSASPCRAISSDSSFRYSPRRSFSANAQKVNNNAMSKTNTAHCERTASSVSSPRQDVFTRLAQPSPIRQTSLYHSLREGSPTPFSKTIPTENQKEEVLGTRLNSPDIRGLTPIREKTPTYSKKSSRQMTPVRYHPGSRSIGGYTPRSTNHITPTESTSTSSPAGNTISRVATPQSTTSSRRDLSSRVASLKKKDLADLSQALVDVVSTVPGTYSFTPLLCASPSRVIARNAFTKEIRSASTSTEWNRSEQRIIKGSTTTATFERSKKNGAQWNSYLQRSVLYDPSFEFVENCCSSETDTGGAGIKSSVNTSEVES